MSRPSPHPLLTLLGFLIAGIALAGVAPVAFSLAGNHAPQHSGAVSSAITVISYSGFLLGPALIGGLAELFSLRLALAALILGGGLILGLSFFVREALDLRHTKRSASGGCCSLRMTLPHTSSERKSSLFRSRTRRDWAATVILLIAALGALSAFGVDLVAFGALPASMQIAEIWRMYGFVVFAGLFGLLAYRLRGYLGVCIAASGVRADA